MLACTRVLQAILCIAGAKAFVTESWAWIQDGRALVMLAGTRLCSVTYAAPLATYVASGVYEQVPVIYAAPTVYVQAPVAAARLCASKLQ